jgi:hypothetical protein
MANLLRRRKNKIPHADRPAAVTGNFELHYEEVVRNNRFAIIAFIATGLVAMAAFIPTAVYHSVAGSSTVTIEAENAQVIDGARISTDAGASDGRFILFSGSVEDNQQ